MYRFGSLSRESVILLAIIAIAGILAVILLLSPQFSKKPSTIGPSKLTKEASSKAQNIQFIPPESPLSQDTLTAPGAKYFNEKLYDENADVFSKLPTPIQSHRFQGVVTSIDRSDGLVFHISSTMSNSTGVDLIYGYLPASLSKIKVNGGSLDALTVGQEIYIDETNDYSKPYQDSITSVLIHDVK